MLFFRLFLSLIESKLIKGLFIWRVEDPGRFSVFISLCKLQLFLSQALGSSYIVVGSSQIEMKDYAKYLCVMITSNLVWKYHTQSICHKMRKEKQLTTTITTKTWVL